GRRFLSSRHPRIRTRRDRSTEPVRDRAHPWPLHSTPEAPHTRPAGQGPRWSRTILRAAARRILGPGRLPGRHTKEPPKPGLTVRPRVDWFGTTRRHPPGTR